MTSCTYSTLQHTATHCNTLQYTATHCNTLQHAATHCNTLYRSLQYTVTRHHTHIPAPYLVCRVSTYACYLYISIKIYVIFGLFLFTFSNLIFCIPAAWPNFFTACLKYGFYVHVYGTIANTHSDTLLYTYPSVKIWMLYVYIFHDFIYTF